MYWLSVHTFYRRIGKQHLQVWQRPSIYTIYDDGLNVAFVDVVGALPLRFVASKTLRAVKNFPSIVTRSFVEYFSTRAAKFLSQTSFFDDVGTTFLLSTLLVLETLPLSIKAGMSPRSRAVSVCRSRRAFVLVTCSAGRLICFLLTSTSATSPSSTSPSTSSTWKWKNILM